MFYQKKKRLFYFIAFLNHFFPYKLCVTEERTHFYVCNSLSFCQCHLIIYLDNEDETDVKTENENDPENPEKTTEKSPKKKSKKEYTCQLCFKNFKDSYKLKRHGKVHQVRVSERISCEELAIFFPKSCIYVPYLTKSINLSTYFNKN